MADTIQCPKCGFEQNEGTECRRCGIIFSRMRQAAEMPVSEKFTGSDRDSSPSATGCFRRYFRILRWMSLLAIITVTGLILCDSTSPEVETTPYATQQAEIKLRQFQSDIGRGRKGKLELDQSELNGWLETNLAMQGPADSGSSRFQDRESSIGTIDTVLEQYEIGEESFEEAKSSIRDLQVELLTETLRLYALFETYGIDLSLEIEGRLRVQDGYLRLDPIRGRLGSLPLPSGTLQSAVDKIFEAPDNREKFRLPPNIRDIKIDRGQLVVSSM